MLLFDLLFLKSKFVGNEEVISDKSGAVDLETLQSQILSLAKSMLRLGFKRHDRAAIYLDKRIETIVSYFATSAAGGAFVPINPLLRSPQVKHIMNDCSARVLITNAGRLTGLLAELHDIPDLVHIIVIDCDKISNDVSAAIPIADGLKSWDKLMDSDPGSVKLPRMLDSDMAAILYTSGSTGGPKGVVLSHRNLVVGAQSVAEYLELTPKDKILSALPLSFDAGLSQLTTAFAAGAKVVLHNYFSAKEMIGACTEEGITGLTCVPPLWIDLAEREWPEEARQNLRFFANTGGHMPKVTLDRLRAIFPKAKPFLMYGLTEAFRSTYLDPSEVDRRPDSIGKAIPNVEILVANADGQECETDEVGELVHRGPLVSLGYWNDPERTAKRFRAWPLQPSGIPLTELAVWSGDLVRRDAEGFLYFVGRKDEMIKTSGYRVSPTEIEEVVLSAEIVDEAAAFGIAHSRLGQAIIIAVASNNGAIDVDAIMQLYRKKLPLFMVPSEVKTYAKLPRNANGKIDRAALYREWSKLYLNAE